MSLIYHSFGACVPYVGVGTANALVALGNGARPGDIFEKFEREPRRMDGAGNVAADFQAMGETAEIIIPMGSWDDTVMDLVISRSTAGGAIGSLLATGGFSFALYLPSATDRPWYFPCVVADDPKRQPGMKSDDHSLRFMAWKPLSATGTTTYGSNLYTRVAP